MSVCDSGSIKCADEPMEGSDLKILKACEKQVFLASQETCTLPQDLSESMVFYMDTIASSPPPHLLSGGFETVTPMELVAATSNDFADPKDSTDKNYSRMSKRRRAGLFTHDNNASSEKSPGSGDSPLLAAKRRVDDSVNISYNIFLDGASNFKRSGMNKFSISLSSANSANCFVDEFNKGLMTRIYPWSI